jgi:hypothetical protein
LDIDYCLLATQTASLTHYPKILVHQSTFKKMNVPSLSVISAPSAPP